MAEIRNIIHCVWVGGGDLATSKKYDGIESWRRLAPGYNVWIWTDSLRLKAGLIRYLIKEYRAINRLYLEQQYQRGKGSRPRELRWTDPEWDTFLDSLLANASVPAAAKKKIEDDRDSGQKNYESLLATVADMNVPIPGYDTEIKVVDLADGYPSTMSDWAYNLEMCTRGINFAGASDIIRYGVLAQFGGIYIDVDLELQEELGPLVINDRARNDLLVGILPSAGQRPKVNKHADTIFARAVGDEFIEKEPYVTNALLATNAGGDSVTNLNLSISEIYSRIFPEDPTETPKSLTIQKYWFSMPTKSTLDITGPNLVRDVLLGKFINLKPEYFNEFLRKRLSYALKGLSTVKDLYEKQFLNYRTDDDGRMLDYLMYNRHAETWPEGNIEYRGFWDWYAQEALFPVGYIKFDTEAAGDSSTSALLNMRY